VGNKGGHRFLDGGQVLAAASSPPIGHQRGKLPSHVHQPKRGFRAVQIVPDLVAHGVLDALHLCSQEADAAYS
jgi:hypothetical protein